MATSNPKIRAAIDRAKTAVAATNKLERGLTDLIAQLEAEHADNVERMLNQVIPQLYEKFGNALDAFGHDVADACIELGTVEPRPVRVRDRNKEEAAQRKEINRGSKKRLAAEREKLDAIAAKVPDLGEIHEKGSDPTATTRPAESVSADDDKTDNTVKFDEETKALAAERQKTGGLGLKELTDEQRKVAAAAEAKGGEGETGKNENPSG